MRYAVTMISPAQAALTGLLLLSTGCSTEAPPLDAAPSDTGALDTATPDSRPDSVTPPADAGGDRLEPGDHMLTLDSGGLTRTYVLHVPPDLDPSTRYPLVVFLHGGNGTAAMIQMSTRFDAVADRESFLVVYPDGIANNWNGGRGTSDAELMGVDDVTFIRELIAATVMSAGADEGRVFAIGVSNGGMMMHRLACEAADVITAVVPVISALAEPLATCTPARPISMLAIQGDDDPFIPIDGGDTHHRDRPALGDGGNVLSADATRTHWREANGCTSFTSEVLVKVDPADPTEATVFRERDCTDGVLIDYYIVAGMGHTYPPNPARLAISGASSPQLDTNELAAEFFRTVPAR